MADKPNITKWTDEELIEILTPDIESAQTLQDTLSLQRAEYYSRYRMEAYGNEREGFSKTVAPVIHNNHSWTMANLMDIFNEDFFLLKGDDDVRSAKFQKLIYYQMFRKQDGFRKYYDFVWTADLNHYSVFKCYYKEDFELDDQTYEQVSADEMLQLAQKQDTTVSKYTEETDITGQTYYKNVKTVTKNIKYAGPSFSSLPLWEFFYSPDCKITDWGAIEGRLVYHKVKRTLNDIRKKEKAGIYRKGTFEKIKDKVEQVSADPIDKTEILFNVDELPDQSPQESSDKEETLLNKQVEIKECYFKLDIDSDGLLENVIIDVCDNVVCRIEENPYRRPPFRIGHVSPEPHKVTGVPMPELLDNDQRIQTNLLRLIQDSAALDCYKNPVTNDHQMFTMLQDRKPFAVIKGDPTRLGEVKTSPPTDFVIKAIEMCKQDVEEKTGMTRYNQGTDAKSLNKTATGIDAIMQASNKPLRLIARILGNGAIMGLIRDFIFINQLYPPKTDIAILGTDITVNKDDMTGEHDIEIDIGVSPAERQAMANQVDLLLQFATQAGIQMGIMTPIHVMKAIRKKYKYLGTKVDDLLMTEQDFQKAQEEKKNAPPKPPDLREYVQLDKLFPLMTPMEQGQVLHQFNIQPDPRRQVLPPQALGGEPPPQPGQGQIDPAQHQQLVHQQQAHQQQMQHNAQQHATDIAQQTQAMQHNAMDQHLKMTQPYPQGVTR